MTEWFKQNPFLGGMAAAAVLLLLLGGFVVFSQATRLAEEQSSFDGKKATLNRLERGKPYPDQASFLKTEKETKEARELLAEIAAGFEVKAPILSPQAFQDELSKAVKEIADMAAAKSVALPEGFYLGFEAYETQPPLAEATAQLGLQLRAIHAVAKALIDSQVKSLGPFVRAPLPSETPAAEEKESAEDADRSVRSKAKDTAPSFAMAPFDVNFTADQAAFRLAFNRLLDITPPVFVRLVALTNSAPAGPSKQEPVAEVNPAAGDAGQAQGIRTVLGRETLTVDLRLASISMAAEAKP